MRSLFDRLWDMQAQCGFCDARGSAEYCRLRKKWGKQKYRTNDALLIVEWIIKQANHAGVPCITV